MVTSIWEEPAPLWSRAGADGAVGEPPEGSLQALGAWLRVRRSSLDAGEAAWLAGLARFDREAGWAADGCLSAVGWLYARAGMARSTAYEKLQMARELERRPVLREAFGEGRVSYSAVRVIARAVGAEPETDAALVVVAECGTLADVELAVARYLACARQDREPAELRARRGLRLVPQWDGTTRVEGVLSDLEAVELDARLREMIARRAGDEVGGDAGVSDSAVAESGSAARSEGPVDPEPHYPAMMADALMDLVRAAAGEGVPGGDRYLVHVVVREDGGVELLGGPPLSPGMAAVVRCDGGSVTHVVDGAGAPLRLGRRRRTWSVAQRRAVAVRDGGRCRFPGCGHRMVDVHHMVAWEDGGATDVDNGLLLCRRHHELVHAGWRITGDPAGTLCFGRPAG